MNQQPNFSEQELLGDLLNQEKQMITSYATFLTEASCHNLRKVLSGKGYYQGSDASDQEVLKVKTTYKALNNDF